MGTCLCFNICHESDPANRETNQRLEIQLMTHGNQETDDEVTHEL